MRTIRLEDGVEQAVQAAVDVLRRGGVIAFPTETTYGLGCDPRNQAAMGKIYRIKGRDPAKALPLVTCDFNQVKKFFEVPTAVINLAERYWPGPLTVLLAPADMSLRKAMPVFKDGLAAVRVSSHAFVQALTQAYGFPLTATSANLSGGIPCLTADEVVKIFETQDASRQPDLIINGGELKASEPSTIVKVDGEGKIEVVRQGAVSLTPPASS